ncbi:hypothetical protein EIN_371500 [Entamoeba invadens IP1]|uniref:Chaperone DnaJ C-terminal domain-containing protein n=1 Tax=Entamoeba invadens IP1 TaxID=370355 RepID=A0A0A1UC75_ENTIV|nr:hypothetical protein EIN_371500 [Entamoeba invadens IP1]ELP92738.1 hypothetical protein EIN_371500 [Entamoeba invadens IP1]|eukprot:XP_004259509.1 hypothetical protein EIN_371500 [Entamoeba invadens IP1]
MSTTSFPKPAVTELFLQMFSLRALIPQAFSPIIQEIENATRCSVENVQSDFYATGSLIYNFCISLATLADLARDDQYVKTTLLDSLTRHRVSYVQPPQNKTTLFITFYEAFNGCEKTINIQGVEYTFIIPKYSINGVILQIQNQTVEVEVLPDSTYTVFDNGVFVSTDLSQHLQMFSITLPDETAHKIARSYIEQLGSVEIEGYPFKIHVVALNPNELHKAAFDGKIEQLTGKTVVFRKWDLTLLKAPSFLRREVSKQILMTFNVQKTNHIESFEINEENMDVALKFADHTSAVTLSHALKYPNQTFVIPQADKTIFISTLTPHRVTRYDIKVPLPIMCEGGVVDVDKLGIKLKVPKRTKPGSTLIHKKDNDIFVIQVDEMQSGFFIKGEDVLTSVELPESSKETNFEVKVVTLNGKLVNVHGNLTKVLRIVGGGIPLENGYGDLVITFTPKGQILREKEYYQIAKYVTKISICNKEFVQKEKQFVDGSVIPKIYRIPKNLNANAKKRNYFVRFPGDGDVRDGFVTDLVFEVVPRD